MTLPESPESLVTSLLKQGYLSAELRFLYVHIPRSYTQVVILKDDSAPARVITEAPGAGSVSELLKGFQDTAMQPTSLGWADPGRPWTAMSWLPESVKSVVSVNTPYEAMAPLALGKNINKQPHFAAKYMTYYHA